MNFHSVSDAERALDTLNYSAIKALGGHTRCCSNLRAGRRRDDRIGGAPKEIMGLSVSVLDVGGGWWATENRTGRSSVFQSQGTGE